MRGCIFTETYKEIIAIGGPQEIMQRNTKSWRKKNVNNSCLVIADCGGKSGHFDRLRPCLWHYRRALFNRTVVSDSDGRKWSESEKKGMFLVRHTFCNIDTSHGRFHQPLAKGGFMCRVMSHGASCFTGAKQWQNPGTKGRHEFVTWVEMRTFVPWWLFCSHDYAYVDRTALDSGRVEACYISPRANLSRSLMIGDLSLTHPPPTKRCGRSHRTLVRHVDPCSHDPLRSHPSLWSYTQSLQRRHQSRQLEPTLGGSPAGPSFIQSPPPPFLSISGPWTFALRALRASRVPGDCPVKQSEPQTDAEKGAAGKKKNSTTSTPIPSTGANSWWKPRRTLLPPVAFPPLPKHTWALDFCPSCQLCAWRLPSKTVRATDRCGKKKMS